MNYWLVKSEPSAYSWQKFVEEGSAVWDGVRNYQARNNLKKMKKSDRVLFYHSNEEQEIVGLAEVVKEFYPDPTADDLRWVVVELAPRKPLKVPVKLSQVKSHPQLNSMALVKQSRLSVMPVTKKEFDLILDLGMG